MRPMLYRTRITFEALSDRPLPPETTLGDLIASIDAREMAAGSIRAQPEVICVYESEKLLKAFGEPLDFAQRRESHREVMRVAEVQEPMHPADGLMVVDGAVVPYTNSLPGFAGYRTHVWLGAAENRLPSLLTYHVRRTFNSASLSYSLDLPRAFSRAAPGPVGRLSSDVVDAVAARWDGDHASTARREGWALCRGGDGRWDIAVLDETALADSEAVFQMIARRSMAGSCSHQTASLLFYAQEMADRRDWSMRARLSTAPQP